ncbi:hypothetical protein EV122DRAFT_226339 [Schizophyllum commune]
MHSAICYLRQLFSYRPNPEKTGLPRMTPPHRPISPVIQDGYFACHPDALLANLAQAHEDPDRARTVRECGVDEVARYREVTSEKGAHEFVVFHFHHDSGGDDGAVLTDRRVGRMERLRELTAEEYSSLIPRSTTSLADITREESQRSPTNNLDRITIVENAEVWLSAHRQYMLVASFTPQAGALNIVDCVVAAHVLTQRARYYTTLQFMCMWYASSIFGTLHRLAGRPHITPGPAYDIAGRFGSVAMVDSSGDLLFTEESHTLDEARKQMATLLRLGAPGTDNDAAEASLATFMTELRDVAGDTKIEVQREVDAQTRSMRSYHWAVTEKAALRHRRDRDAVERVKWLEQRVCGFCDQSLK